MKTHSALVERILNVMRLKTRMLCPQREQRNSSGNNHNGNGNVATGYLPRRERARLPEEGHVKRFYCKREVQKPRYKKAYRARSRVAVA